MKLRFQALGLRSLGHVSVAIVALLASACGDDSDGSSSGGGSGGGTTASTGVTTSSSVASTSGGPTSSQSSSGQGGDENQGGGGSGQGGEPSQGGAGQGGEPSQGGAGQGGEPAQGGGGSGQGGGTGGDGTGGEGGNPLEPSDLFVASNPALRDADAALRVGLDLAAIEATYPGPADIVSLQNVALDGNQDGWISYDVVGGTGGLMFVANLQSRADAGSLGGGRRIEGPLTGLITPKGVRVIDGMVMVTDTTAKTISAFDLEDEGDVEPLFVIELGANNPAIWDFDYDEEGDILYCAGTNGDVVVFDDFLTDSGANGPTRTFSPAANGTKISVNLHGIELAPGFLGDPDVLVLSDVGDATVATDGQIFTIADAEDANGIKNVRGRIFGTDSLLGNPVDLDVSGDAVFVAEKLNDRILRFDGISGLDDSGDATADDAVTATKIESVAIRDGVLPDVHAIANPAGRDADALVRFDALLNLQATVGTPGHLQSIESLVLDQAGNAFATLDAAGPSGSILVFDGLAAAATGTLLGDGTRRIEGDATNLVAPKGLQIADIDGPVLLVADAGTPTNTTTRDVKAFALDDDGDVEPLFTVDDLGADRAPWDVHYDAASDRLFVACTDGVVVVFDAFSSDMGADGPDRTITPAVTGADVSTNLHGIDYLAGEDILVLSDVGDAANATDGRLYTIATASTADGLVNVQVRISGVDTLLGNPVDIAVVDGSVYVAEKSNDRVLRYDTIGTLTGEVTTAANGSLTVTKPESVFVRYE